MPELALAVEVDARNAEMGGITQITLLFVVAVPRRCVNEEMRPPLDHVANVDAEPPVGGQAGQRPSPT